MAPAETPSAEWERVLALVEAETEHAEALLALPTTTEATAWLAAPAVLPSRAPLPPVETMPDLTPELRARIVALRARIIELQELLGAALQDARWHMVTMLPPVTPAPDPQFLDRFV
ncbi:MAG: hypothetical protein ACTHMS_21810 [Jatrophihabitans sp.]|uniref:hypothetical protein n=1 Tax=Jatrophihabitans sp. TaxID=1932789 RepID=UPI003F7EB95D